MGCFGENAFYRGDSFAEGVAFVHIELFLAKKPIHKSLWLQDDNDSINLLSGITRRESGLFAKNTWEMAMGLL